MHDRLDEHQQSLAHQAVTEHLWTRPLLDALLPTLGILDGQSILIAESRCGYMPLRLASVVEADTRIMALDPSRAMLDDARVRIPEDMSGRVFFVSQPVHALSYADDVFQCAMCMHGLNTLESLRAGFAELVRVTQRGGRVVLSVPAQGSFPEVVDMFREAMTAHALDSALRRLEDHINTQLITQGMLLALAHEFGLHNVDISLHTWTLNFKSGKQVMSSPVLRETLLPQWTSVIRDAERAQVFAHVIRAIDTYFQGGPFSCEVQALSLVATR